MKTLTQKMASLAQIENLSIIVHCHLRWDFVWQRPQQTHSRLARHFPVLFVEEPVYTDDQEDGLQLSRPQENIIRAVPRLSSTLRGNYDASILAVRALIKSAIAADPILAAQFAAPLQWFYTPMPAPAMLGQFKERAVVYDCMDELAQFHGAPQEIASREKTLLTKADIVFTGGRKLFESKSRFHNNVHFFGCGVDINHYASARSKTTQVPDDVATVKGPIAGYIGVIDERLDYLLIKELADKHPQLQIVMIGPVVKVDPASLPVSPNIHWLGQRDYKDLPAYIKSFDVCLMPFALNDATEYINPTKTLEYMAAKKPVVSTAVTDVIRNFTPIVTVAYTPAEFVAGVNQAIAAPDADLLNAGVEKAQTMTWESIVHQMKTLLEDAVEARKSSLGSKIPVVPAPIGGTAYYDGSSL